MEKELIEEINKIAPEEQGIFIQPYGIPTDVKELVIYTRWETGGYTGGSYHEDSVLRPYTSEIPKNRFDILDIVLKKLKPEITYLQYKEIEKMWQDNNETEREYYGNSTDYEINYIVLSKLENYLNSI